MSKDEILIEIANDKKYIDYCKKVTYNIGDLHKDLFQYVCLYLMEMEYEKLLQLKVSGGLRMYVARVIWISAKSKTSGFQKEYIDNVLKESSEIDYSNESELYVDSGIDVIEKIEKEIELDKKESISNNEYPASAKMFELFLELGNYKRVSKATGIPYRTVLKMTKEFQLKIKNKVK